MQHELAQVGPDFCILREPIASDFFGRNDIQADLLIEVDGDQRGRLAEFDDSMRPRSLERGKLRGAIEPCHSKIGFNEAAKRFFAQDQLIQHSTFRQKYKLLLCRGKVWETINLVDDASKGVYKDESRVIADVLSLCPDETEDAVLQQLVSLRKRGEKKGGLPRKAK